MKVDAPSPTAADDPVEAALRDTEVLKRLNGAARATLGRRARAMSHAQRVAEAEAIAQEAVVRALARRDQFDPARDVVKWLVGFITNVAREQSRRRCRETAASDHDVPVESRAVDPGRSASDVLADQQLASHLLEQLDALDRQMIEMKYWQGKTSAEIGEHFHLTANAVRVRLHRIAESLKSQRRAAGEDQP
jgi:RNA polymerase sigma-70 factor (ECF subfamily)